MRVNSLLVCGRTEVDGSTVKTAIGGNCIKKDPKYPSGMLDKRVRLLGGDGETLGQTGGDYRGCRRCHWRSDLRLPG